MNANQVLANSLMVMAALTAVALVALVAVVLIALQKLLFRQVTCALPAKKFHAFKISFIITKCSNITNPHHIHTAALGAAICTWVWKVGTAYMKAGMIKKKSSSQN